MLCSDGLRRYVRYLFLGITLFAMGFTANAQRYPFYNLSIEQGLIQSQATSLAQDPAGHLWIGTLGGLARYDGHSFTSYSVRDGLPDNMINALHVGKDGQLWIGTAKGLAVYDGSRFKQYIFQSSENPQGNMIYAIRTTDGGNAWCIAGKQIYQIREGKIQSIAFPGAYKNVSAIYTDKQGDLIAMFPWSNALYTYRQAHWDSTLLPSMDGGYYVTKLYRDRAQRLWLLGNTGAMILEGKNARTVALQGSGNEKPPVPSSITEAVDGAFWMGTNSGCIRLTDTTIRFYNKQNGFTDNAIYDAMTDAEGNVWMASDGQGLFRFSGAPFVALDERMKLPSAQIMALASDGNEGLYFGTYDAGLYFYRDQTITPISLPAGMVPPIVAMVTRANDELWIGTRGKGLLRYKNGFHEYTVKTSGLPSNFITALHRTPDNNLWIGFTNGAAVYDGQYFKTLPLKDVVLYDFIALGDTMLMATNNGLKYYYDEQVRPFITNAAPDSASPECFAMQQDLLWIGTSDNGVIAYNLNTGKSIKVNKANGLRSDFVYNIFAARDGSIWAGTGFGIYNIVLKNGVPSVTFFGRGQGVTGVESNHNAVLGMPDGSIWFGTTNGAMHYRPGTQRMTTHPTSIALQAVKLFGERIEDTTYYSGSTPFYNVPLNLRLPPQKNNLTFSFQAISLSDESSLSYRYKMEGLDAQWSDWAPTNTVTYSALPSGKYTLRIQCSVHGKMLGKELTYPFEIITPFHKTTLFRLLIFGGCILLGVSLQYAANKRKQARLRMIEALRREEQAKVRQRTAEDFHDEVGNKLTRINVLTNVLKTKMPEATADARRIIDQIQDNTGQLYSGTRDILWSLKPSNDSAYEILHRIRDFGQDLFGDTEVAFYFEGTEDSWRDFRLPMDASRNLIMIFKEAMNNALKYAEANLVTLRTSLSEDGTLFLQLADNGKGYEEHEIRRGNGLNNMAIRAKRLNGHLAITSQKGKGTVLELRFKIPRNKG